ncbi:MAG: acetyl-CoA C-acyltransferase [Bryobacteraceae bacterium]|jgi:acetyl-CoA acyltransferase
MEAVIIDCLRTPVGKAPKGTLRNTRPDDLAAAVIQGLLKRFPQISPGTIDDVILGCAFPEGEAGMNVARAVAMRAGLPDTVPAYTINRFCSSGLQAIALAADRIRLGDADIVLAGGMESMSMIPMGGNKLAPNPWIVDNMPQLYMGMGMTAECVRKKYGVTREEVDEFALHSHQKAINAQTSGRFDDEIVPIEVESTVFNGHPKNIKTWFNKDEGPRADTSMEALAKLKPAFQTGGIVTAGNSSQTSDGAAIAIVMSEKKAKDLGLKPALRFVTFAVGGVPPEFMGIGPVVAIPKALQHAGLKLDDIGVFELNEAFAAQALAVIKEVGLDPEKVNPNGGAVALGHPLGCTGAKLTATILREMNRRHAKYGMVSMCIGGGQGAAGIFENLN